MIFRRLHANFSPFLKIFSVVVLGAALAAPAADAGQRKHASSKKTVTVAKRAPVASKVTLRKHATEAGEQITRDENSNLGGTMRLGAQACHLEPGTLARKVYGNDTIVERHRHRYEVNSGYIGRLIGKGLRISGRSADQNLVEVVEIPDHPWFLACQFHPEFTSSPRGGHPLFSGFVSAALANKS